MNELALFAGAGGGILGSQLLGFKTICAVEIERYARDILLARQNDGVIDTFPIWDDVRTFDGKPWRGLVDVVSGGFPCQDISQAGKGAGIDGKKSKLWSEFFRIIREVQPRFAFVENSSQLKAKGLYRVLGDLAECGYNARWCVLGADNIGAPHRRKRMWILAYNNSYRCSEKRKCIPTPRNDGYGRNDWWKAEPRVGRVDNGLAYGLDRVRAIGNGQVPAVAATAFIILSEGLI